MLIVRVDHESELQAAFMLVFALVSCDVLSRGHGHVHPMEAKTSRLPTKHQLHNKKHHVSKLNTEIHLRCCVHDIYVTLALLPQTRRMSLKTHTIDLPNLIIAQSPPQRRTVCLRLL